MVLVKQPSPTTILKLALQLEVYPPRAVNVLICAGELVGNYAIFNYDIKGLAVIFGVIGGWHHFDNGQNKIWVEMTSMMY